MSANVLLVLVNPVKSNVNYPKPDPIIVVKVVGKSL